jgi:hypothetical protein
MLGTILVQLMQDQLIRHMKIVILHIELDCIYKYGVGLFKTAIIDAAY